MKTLLLTIGLLILASGSSCLDSQTVLSGQLGQVTDATVISCMPYAQTNSTHQCLLLANPYQGIIKVFDITDNQFVLAPIGYFPLVIQVGQGPDKIATINNRTFTLDPFEKTIFEIPESFVSPLNLHPIPVGLSATDFVLATDANGKIVAFVSSSAGVNEIALEGQTLSTPFSMTAAINSIHINPTQTYLLMAGDKQLWIVDLQNFQSFPVPFSSKISSMTSDSNKALLGLADKTLVVINLATKTIEATSSPLEEVAAAVYLPTSVPGTPSTCCNGATDWVGALLINGKLLYWPYSDKIQSIDIVQTTGIASFALTDSVKLVGAQIQNPGQDGLSCERRLFLVYLGSVFNICEGNSNIKRVDQMGN